MHGRKKVFSAPVERVGETYVVKMVPLLGMADSVGQWANTQRKYGQFVTVQDNAAFVFVCGYGQQDGLKIAKIHQIGVGAGNPHLWAVWEPSEADARFV